MDVNNDEVFAELSIWNKLKLDPRTHLPDELLIDKQFEEDEDEDDMYLYDDPPPTYDVEARLKEINAALAKQFLPDDPKTRQIRVKFREDPVEAQIPPESHCSASSEEEEDDGYGASDDMEDNAAATTTTEDEQTDTNTSGDQAEAENLASELDKVMVIEEKEQVAPEEDKDEANLEEINEQETPKEIETLIQTTVPDEETCVPNEPELTTTSQVATEYLIEPTPKTVSSILPKEEAEEEEETLVMASEGQFHIVNMTNMSSSSLQNVERPKTAVERLPLEESPPSTSRLRTQSSNTLQKLKKPSSCTSKGSEEVPERRRIRLTRVMDTAAHEVLPKPRCRVGYGLTVDQKEERERKLRELTEKRKLKEEKELEEKRERKEKGESAFREWLNQKKKFTTQRTSSDDKTQIKNKEENGEIEESEEAFRKWLQRKRREKDEERKLEELRLRQEEEMFCKKTREENEKAFKQWLLRKSRNRTNKSYVTDGRNRADSGQVKFTFTSSVKRAKLNTIRKTLQMVPEINKIHNL